MKMESKFNFKDIVYKIRQTHKQRFIKCKFCNGSGIVFSADKKTKSDCPECYGRCGETKYQKKQTWILGDKLTIGRIDIEWTCNNEKDYESDFCGNIKSEDGLGATNYGKQDENYEEKYMCYETGIGSGTCHSGDMLFATKKEALKKCEKLNKEK